MRQINALESKQHEIAGLIRELWEVVGLSPRKWPRRPSVIGRISCLRPVITDLNFAFIYRCAVAFALT
jgi:hypothetical protein